LCTSEFCALRPAAWLEYPARIIRGLWDRHLDFAMVTWLGLLDRLAPRPETTVDRAIREEGARLRRAFPWLGICVWIPSGSCSSNRIASAMLPGSSN
jgi:hypothetical protein